MQVDHFRVKQLLQLGDRACALAERRDRHRAKTEDLRSPLDAAQATVRKVREAYRQRERKAAAQRDELRAQLQRAREKRLEQYNRAQVLNQTARRGWPVRGGARSASEPDERAHADALRARLAAIEASKSYQIGRATADAVRRPSESTILLPVQVARIGLSRKAPTGDKTATATSSSSPWSGTRAMTCRRIWKSLAPFLHIGLFWPALAQGDGEIILPGDLSGEPSAVAAPSAAEPADIAATPFRFGGIGNGVADDTDAMKKLMRTSRHVWIPAGHTFLVFDRLEPRSGTRISGTGTIKLGDQGNTNVIHFSGASDIWIDGITIDGNKANQYGGNGIIAQSSRNIRISNTTIKDVHNDAILSDDTSVFDYSHNRIISAGNHGISLSGDMVDSTLESNNGVVASNTILNPAAAGINASEASHVAIAGNMVLHTGGHASGHGGIRVTNGAKHISVTGNTVRGMSRGVFLIEVTDSVVTGNTIEGSYYQGILIDDDVTSSARNVVVANIIRNPGLSGIGGSMAGIQMSDSDDNLIAANIITDARSNMQHGIVESSGATGNLIYGNRIAGWTASRLSLLSDESLMAQAIGTPDGAHAGGSASDDLVPLDEEGSFVPTIQGSKEAGSASYVEQTGSYTRIGNRVFFDVSLTWSGHTGTGDLEVHGLPIASAAKGQSAAAVRSSGIALPAAKGALQGWIDGGANVIELEALDADGTGATDVPMDASGSLYIGGSYRLW